ncbi:PREDICTED: uncharacterized protein LOC109235155 isoform X2 [Nicotiana attenuata]|uniref:uncharacterized protein LOC109235155 isoform X2 n=1 Tax=Nicotiana attenuata TaxID=49451 RepID=UPI000904EACA|nr:PREDICTED: uncharacterized protein LOC109235155 isoform X2 [Nicotiana attenuata]
MKEKSVGQQERDNLELFIGNKVLPAKEACVRITFKRKVPNIATNVLSVEIITKHSSLILLIKGVDKRWRRTKAHNYLPLALLHIWPDSQQQSFVLCRWFALLDYPAVGVVICNH